MEVTTIIVITMQIIAVSFGNYFVQGKGRICSSFFDPSSFCNSLAWLVCCWCFSLMTRLGLFWNVWLVEMCWVTSMSVVPVGLPCHQLMFVSCMMWQVLCWIIFCAVFALYFLSFWFGLEVSLGWNCWLRELDFTVARCTECANC